MLDKIQQQKKAAGEYAASLVENGMVVGLGTGSTVRYFVDRLGERVANEGLDIVGVTTSNRTAKRVAWAFLWLTSMRLITLI